MVLPAAHCWAGLLPPHGELEARSVHSSTTDFMARHLRAQLLIPNAVPNCQSLPMHAVLSPFHVEVLRSGGQTIYVPASHFSPPFYSLVLRMWQLPNSCNFPITMHRPQQVPSDTMQNSLTCAAPHTYGSGAL